MFCPRCGASVDDAASFCQSCGAQLAGERPAARATRRGAAGSLSRRLVLLAACAAVFVAVVAALAIFGGTGASTPPQGSFVFGDWLGFYVNGNGIRISETSADGAEDDVWLSGTLERSDSGDGGTVWRVETDDLGDDHEVYLQIPDGARKGNIEGAWTVTNVYPGEDGAETWYISYRCMFNADGTATYDFSQGADPAADLIRSLTAPDEVHGLPDFDGDIKILDDLAVWIEHQNFRWHENADGTYSFDDGFLSTAIINPDE